MDYPKYWEKLTCHDWCEDEKKIWLCLQDKNAICEIDKNSRNIKILGSFPHNGLGESDLSLSVQKCGEYIIFCPFKANDIAILNVVTGGLEFIDLLQFSDMKKCTNAGIEKFYRMIFYKNYILFLGIRYPLIMRLDLITKKVDFFDEWLGEIEKHKCKEAVFFTDGYAQEKNRFFFPIGKCSGVLKVNLDTMDWELIELKPDLRGILGMTQAEGFVWLTEHHIEADSFFQWDLDNERVLQIGMPCRDAFYAPLYYKKSLLFFHNTGKNNYRYELESGKWEEISNVMPGLENSSDKKVSGDDIDYFSNKSGRFYHWNFETGEAHYEEFKISEKDFLKNSWEDYCKQRKKKEIYEDKLTLKDYIEEVVCFRVYVSGGKEGIGKKITDGEHIWRVLVSGEK